MGLRQQTVSPERVNHIYGVYVTLALALSNWDAAAKKAGAWYAMWRDAAGRLVQKATPARAKAEATYPRSFPMKRRRTCSADSTPGGTASARRRNGDPWRLSRSEARSGGSLPFRSCHPQPRRAKLRYRERQAWRQREGLEPLPNGRLTFGELLDWWWARYGSARRGYPNSKFLPFLLKHVGELRDFEINPATAGLFADRLDQLPSQKEDVLSPQSLNHLRSAVFSGLAIRSTARGSPRTPFGGSVGERCPKPASRRDVR
ncbi:MAG TPA: hypothetical protein VMK42_13385 [Anaeromyxobacteraceae bacterium]|nr:hypothetical protein [Anaeromyxobacteraceae bacterium]